MAKKSKATVEFDANTSKFQSNIKKADTELVGFRKELKLNSSELKEDAENVDLLSERKAILQKEASSSENKIKALNDKLEVAKKMFGDSSEEVRLLTNKLTDAKTEYQNIQNEITQTSSKIDKFSDSTNQAKKKLEEAEQSTDKLADGFTVFKGVIVNVVTEALSNLRDSLKDLIIDGQAAYSQFAASTGVGIDAMEEFEDKMNELYEEGYGDSFDDIAQSMAEIKQQTKETDPSKLKELTKNAMILKDVYGYDIKESMRAINMLTDQFGISSEEAFNLVVQGAQNGLDKNGDLLDTINEYSVHYSDLGFTSEQFFNSLINGASSGTFSIDKLGDAMKEFGIRSKDNSDSTNQAFKDLGLNAKAMTKAFNNGGDEAQEAFDKVWVSLMSIQDPIKQNEIGIALFGTMWEDLGMDAISALSDVNAYTENTNVAIDKSKNSLEELANVKYDNLKNDWNVLSRQIQMDFIVPISQKLMPILKSGMIWIKENLNWLIPAISIIGTMLASYFAVSKIMSVVNTIKLIFTISKSGIGIMKSLNLVLNMNPIGLIVAAVVGLIAAFVLLWKKCDWFRNFWINLWNNIVSIFKNTINSIQIGWDKVVNFFKKTVNFVSSLLTGYINIVKNVWLTIANFLNTYVVTPIRNIISAIVNFFVQNLMVIVNYIKNIFTIIIQLIQGYINTVKIVWGAIIEWVNTTIIQPIVNFFSNMWNTIQNMTSLAKDFVVNIWSTVSSWFNTTLIQPIVGFFSSMWSKVKSGASSAWSGIKSIFSSVASFFGNIFSNAWAKVKAVFSAGGKIFDGIKDGIVSSFKKVVNAIIDGINKVIKIPFDGINKALNKIRNVNILGHKPFDGLINEVSVPKIPRLKVGLDYVPSDYFPAFLDEGERVLTKQENALFNSLGGFDGILASKIYDQSNSFNSKKLDELIELEKRSLSKEWIFQVNDREMAKATRTSNDIESANLINLKKRGLSL